MNSCLEAFLEYARPMMRIFFKPPTEAIRINKRTRLKYTPPLSTY